MKISLKLLNKINLAANLYFFLMGAVYLSIQIKNTTAFLLADTFQEYYLPITFSVFYFIFQGIIYYILNTHVAEPIEKIDKFSKNYNFENYVQQKQKSSLISEIDKLSNNVTNFPPKVNKMLVDKLSTEHKEETKLIIRRVIHDLLNSLNSIRALSDMQRDSTIMSQEAKAISQDITKNVDSLIERSKVIVSYYSDIIIDNAICDLNELITNALTSVDFIIQKKRININRNEIYKTIPINVDKTLIQRALACVLLNAAQALPRSMNEITIDIQFKDNNKKVDLKIIDEGRGMPLEIISSNYTFGHITKNTQSQGMGLPYVKKVCALMDITVKWRNNTDKQGVTVNFEFNLE